MTPSPQAHPDWLVTYLLTGSSEQQALIVLNCASREVAISAFLQWAVVSLEDGFVPVILGVTALRA